MSMTMVDDPTTTTTDENVTWVSTPLCPPLSPEATPRHWPIVYDPTDPAAKMNLKGRDYMQVAQRMVWFISEQRHFIRMGVAVCPFSIKTRLVAEREGWAEYEATVTDVFGNTCTMSGSEAIKDFTDYREKAQTKAAGRALLGLGYGTAFAADELDETDTTNGEPRVVDSPVQRRGAQNSAQNSAQNNAQQAQQAQRAQPSRPDPRPAPPDGDAPARKTPLPPSDPNHDQPPATEQQMVSIRKLCEALHRPTPDDGISYAQARQMITTLSAEYQKQRRANAS